MKKESEKVEKIVEKSINEKLTSSNKEIIRKIEENFKRKFEDLKNEVYKDAKYLLSLNYKIRDGEYAMDEIQKLILNRSIRSRNYYICKSGTDNWQPITSVQSLKNAFDTVEGKT